MLVLVMVSPAHQPTRSHIHLTTRSRYMLCIVLKKNPAVFHPLLTAGGVSTAEFDGAVGRILDWRNDISHGHVAVMEVKKLIDEIARVIAMVASSTPPSVPDSILGEARGRAKEEEDYCNELWQANILLPPNGTAVAAEAGRSAGVGPGAATEADVHMRAEKVRVARPARTVLDGTNELDVCWLRLRLAVTEFVLAVNRPIKATTANGPPAVHRGSTSPAYVGSSQSWSVGRASAKYFAPNILWDADECVARWRTLAHPSPLLCNLLMNLHPSHVRTTACYQVLPHPARVGRRAGRGCRSGVGRHAGRDHVRTT